MGGRAKPTPSRECEGGGVERRQDCTSLPELREVMPEPSDTHMIKRRFLESRGGRHPWLRGQHELIGYLQELFPWAVGAEKVPGGQGTGTGMEHGLSINLLILMKAVWLPEEQL